MSLQRKILGVLLLLLVLIAVTDYTIDRLLIFHNYVTLEQAQAKKDLARCVEALNAEIRHLDISTDDWSAWDDTYQFLQNRNEAYIKFNLVIQTFLDNKLNLINYYDVNGTLVWGQVMDLDTQTLIKVSPFNKPSLPLSHPLLNNAKVKKDASSGTSGIFLTDKGPMLICSKPILTSDHRGPHQGYLIMGKLLSTNLLARLARQTHVDHKIWPIGDKTMADDDRRAIIQINQQDPVYIKDTNDVLHVYAKIPDIFGNPTLLLRAITPKDITAKGIASIRFGILSNILMSFSFLLVLLGLVKYLILQPIASLTHHAVNIREKNDLSLRLDNRRQDELGVLSREFDRLVAQQEQIQTSLKREIEERRLTEKQLDIYHQKLRKLSAELLMTEERERRKIAINLHDHIGQSLAISKMRVDALTENLSPLEVPIKIEQISQLLEKCIQDTRTLTFELSPPILYEFGLSTALQWLSDKFIHQHGLEIHFNSDETNEQIDPSLRVMLFQATRELLYNIVKHAHSSAVKMTMTSEHKFIKITVRDNGVGFDPSILNNYEQYEDKGFGLFNIKERINHIGGRFKIESAPGKGTQVCLECLSKPNSPDDPGEELS
jgi:signal transduction histidine kinase